MIHIITYKNRLDLTCDYILFPVIKTTWYIFLTFYILNVISYMAVKELWVGNTFTAHHAVSVCDNNAWKTNLERWTEYSSLLVERKHVICVLSDHVFLIIRMIMLTDGFSYCIICDSNVFTGAKVLNVKMTLPRRFDWFLPETQIALVYVGIRIQPMLCVTGTHCNLTQLISIAAVSNITTWCVMQHSKGPILQEDSSIVSAQTLTAATACRLTVK